MTSGPGAPATPDGAGPARPAQLGRSVALDVVGVAVFVLLGRGTHDPDDVLGGLSRTAWPFLVSLGAGWLLARAWRDPVRLWPTGAVVWVVTAGGGLALRALTGGGVSGAFPVVTAIALAVLLLGWRGVLALSRRRGSTPPRGRRSPSRSSLGDDDLRRD